MSTRFSNEGFFFVGDLSQDISMKGWGHSSDMGE